MLQCTDGLFMHELDRPVSQGRSPTLDQAVCVDEVVTHTHTLSKTLLSWTREKKGANSSSIRCGASLNAELNSVGNV